VKQLVLVAIAALAVAATAQAAPRSGAQVAVRSSQYGKVLFTGGDRALYAFGADKNTTSHCYGTCAKAWPPLLTTGKPVPGAGVDHMLLGTTKRTDGTVQVTYKGHPLYTYSGDSVGHVGCQHVNANGGLWLVLDHNGHLNMSQPKK
jgi:predicted lipoprotein with Yx(FWY)xxD motif